MAVIELEDIRDAIIEATPLGRLVTLTDGAATSITDDQELKGPHPASMIPRGSPIRVRDKTSAGSPPDEDTFVDVYDPSSGQITIEPDLDDFTPAATDEAEIWIKEIGHVDRVGEKINRALTEHCGFYAPFVLTLVTDGDMEGATASTDWEGTDAQVTLSKSGLGFPSRMAHRQLLVTNNDASDYATPKIKINVVPDDTYQINVLGRATTSTMTLAVRDETNGADITLDSEASSTIEQQWVRLRSSFVIPSGCYQIRPRLGGASATAATRWAALSILRSGDRRISLPSRITARSRLGRVYQRLGDKVDNFYRSTDIEYDIDELGDAFDLILPQGIQGSVWPPYAEEWQNYASLTADADTTVCEQRYVQAIATWLIYLALHEQEELNRSGPEWVNRFRGGLRIWTEQKRAVEREFAPGQRSRARFPQLQTVAARV